MKSVQRRSDAVERPQLQHSLGKIDSLDDVGKKKEEEKSKANCRQEKSKANSRQKHM